ncbi:MAG: regulatory protein RecX [Desulfatitalea sp.]|nr:recombination regulator RecX [Desulfatitalea sp.]NNK01446.1 regulatory protein RecX [Desulfatitalea sp.]
MIPIKRKCLECALRLLGRRAHSRRELADKLSQRGFDTGQIALAIDECIRLNYLDDASFCDTVVRHQRRKGYGRARIAQLLNEKGVAKSHIDDCLVRYCDESAQYADCRALSQKKKQRYLGKGAPAFCRQKLFRFLTRRGFSSTIVQRVVAECISAEGHQGGQGDDQPGVAFSDVQDEDVIKP